jgi:hypothetical protein
VATPANRRVVNERDRKGAIQTDSYHKDDAVQT